jgi:hydrogenase expression/formation protein HypC
MCVAVPVKLVDVQGSAAVGEVGGARVSVNLDLLGEATTGQYVLVHAGYAIERLDAEQAERTLAALREAGLA